MGWCVEQSSHGRNQEGRRKHNIEASQPNRRSYAGARGLSTSGCGGIPDVLHVAEAELRGLHVPVQPGFLHTVTTLAERKGRGVSFLSCCFYRGHLLGRPPMFTYRHSMFLLRVHRTVDISALRFPVQAKSLSDLRRFRTHVSRFFFKAITSCTPALGDQPQRVENLRRSLRFTVYSWVTRGLFEKHRLTFLTQLTFGLLHVSSRFV